MPSLRQGGARHAAYPAFDDFGNVLESFAIALELIEAQGHVTGEVRLVTKRVHGLCVLGLGLLEVALLEEDGGVVDDRVRIIRQTLVQECLSTTSIMRPKQSQEPGQRLGRTAGQEGSKGEGAEMEAEGQRGRGRG